MTVALKNMEKSLNVALFTRHAKGLYLTEAGERFVRHAQNVINAVERGIDDICNTPDDLHGHLRIGVTETISAYLMPSVITAAVQQFPNLPAKSR